jgi:DNA-3-methyladenine glycosylase II
MPDDNQPAPKGLGGRAARQHLAQDPILGPVVKRVGAFTLKLEKREPYEALVRAIAHQQVHGRAAEAMLRRLVELFPGQDFPDPAGLLALPDGAIRGCGFSGAKVAAILDIAHKTTGGLVPTRRAAARLSDEALIERLVAIRGVGRWTVEMLLIFTLGRPDILPVDDFGVREGFRHAAGLALQPKPKALAEVGQSWAPFRSAAAWYLWRYADLAKSGGFKAPTAL